MMKQSNLKTEIEWEAQHYDSHVT